MIWDIRRNFAFAEVSNELILEFTSKFDVFVVNCETCLTDPVVNQIYEGA